MDFPAFRLLSSYDKQGSVYRKIYNSNYKNLPPEDDDQIDIADIDNEGENEKIK
jgi:hypothetical protein